VRVPFNTVLLGLDALMAEVTDRSELLGDVRLMKQAAEMMLRVLNDSLDIEKMRAGQYTLEFKEGSLLNVLHGVLRSMEPWARQDRVGLFLEIRSGIPHNVLCDANRLTQALLNLVSNAVKFVPHDGTGWVKVRAFRIARPSARRGALAGVVQGSGSRSTLGVSVESDARLSAAEGTADAESDDGAMEENGLASQGAAFEAEPPPPFSWRRPLTWPLAVVWLVETGLGRASDAMHICMCTVLVAMWDGLLALLWRGLGSCSVAPRTGLPNHRQSLSPSHRAGREVVLLGPVTASAAVSTSGVGGATPASGLTGAAGADLVAIDVGAGTGAAGPATAATVNPPQAPSAWRRWWPWCGRADRPDGGLELGTSGAAGLHQQAATQGAAGNPTGAPAPAATADASHPGGNAGSPIEQPLGRTRGGGLAFGRHVNVPAVFRIGAPKSRKSATSSGSARTSVAVEAGAGLPSLPRLPFGAGAAAPPAQHVARAGSGATASLASSSCPKDIKSAPGSSSRSGASAPTSQEHPSAARAAAAKLERVWIRFEVQDNGVGIKPEDQVKLFTAFHQIQAGALQKGGGSGLGLSICKEIVRRHGGAVGVQSAPGQGSTFYAEVSCRSVGPCSARSLCVHVFECLDVIPFVRTKLLSI
jgi:hypothetical protein